MRVSRRTFFVVIGSVLLVGCAANDLLRRGWTRRSDESIYRDIKNAFRKAGPEYLALDLVVRDQRVTLKGSLPSKEQKLEAERIIWEISGIDALINAVEVK